MFGKGTVKVRWLVERDPLSVCYAHRNLQKLLVYNTTVYFAVQSAQKANKAIAEPKIETGKQAIFL